jgi:nitrite reductase (NADH) large subunit
MVLRKQLVVVGNGMVGHRLIEQLIERGLNARWSILAFCEEPRPAYDRVNLSQFFIGSSADALSLLSAPDYYARHGVEVRIGVKVAAIDRAKKSLATSTGERLAYDRLVLATGSTPFVPRINGSDGPGCFVYRTIEDLEAIRAWSKRCATGVVVGGGLLGLEAANALTSLGLSTHVVEFAPRLMSVQVDEGGGAMLRKRVEDKGVQVRTSASTTDILRDASGAVAGMRFSDKSELATQMIVFSAGIRPRDELPKDCGLAMGERGGVAIDERCRTSDADISAIGEVAAYKNRIYGLVAPGYRMAAVVADDLSDAQPATAARFTGFDMSTKLKLLGIEVASFGDAFAATPGSQALYYGDAAAQTYKKLVVSNGGRFLLGGILVGDASSYGQLLQLTQNQIPLPPHPEDLILPARSGAGGAASLRTCDLPDAATICSCHNVRKGAIVTAIADRKLGTVEAVKSCTKAGTGCGSCATLLKDILKAELERAGVTVANHLCEHFPHSRQELYSLVRLHRLSDFASVLERHGKGAGCEICKPALASILASAWNEHVLDDKHLPLQDTNDRFLANIQRDGTYSVVPRVPGGEITPDQLIAIGQTAKRFALYTKITGGQRVDLFGARLEQLPAIWEELVAAGFESGHAYGKALRTVKSCVGSTWCRYGVQDSVALAIRLENRYKGLRAPHKLKSAVSGCARECAEAQGKDFGVIATDKGYNLYVCGNGGMRPRHAELLATDLDAPTLIRYLDRFLMFYIRTADRLERTATWFDRLEGGLEYLKGVVIGDKLGIAAELEAEMAHVVATYQDEWRAVVEDPAKRRRFRAFINSDSADASIATVIERGQPRPAPRAPEGAST